VIDVPHGTPGAGANAGAGRPGGRPQGEIRLALKDAVEVLFKRQGGATWREAAKAAGVGFSSAAGTMWNMVRAGELVVLEYRRVPGSKRPAATFAPAPPADDSQTSAQQCLTAIANAWAGTR